MKAGRSYVVALVVTAIVGVGYVGVTQVQGAQARATARQDVRDLAAYAVKAKAFQARATKLLAEVQAPRGFVKAPDEPSCQSGGPSVCLTTAKRPRASLDAMLAGLRPLGLTLTKNACDDPSKMPLRLRVAMGHTWLPCSAFVELAGTPVAIVAFAMIDEAHSTNSHIVFGDTKVSVTVIEPLDG